MESIVKKLRKKGLVCAKKSFVDNMLDFNLSDPREYESYLEQLLLNKLTDFMEKQGMNQAALAKKMGLSRQAVSWRLLGRNLTLSWLIRCIVAMGGHVNLQTVFPAGRKKRNLHNAPSRKVTKEFFGAR